jgi:hypothetical protein
LEDFFVGGDRKGSHFMHLLPHCTSLSKPDISNAQAATVSSSSLASLPPIEHANAF